LEWVFCKYIAPTALGFASKFATGKSEQITAVGMSDLNHRQQTLGQATAAVIEPKSPWRVAGGCSA
jgi:hypothetical protein